MTINSNNLTYPKIIFIIFIYILYTNKYIIKNYITEKLDIKSHIYLEGKRHFNTSRCFSRYDELYSVRFKAVWNYVNNNIKKLNIKSIKEFSSITGQYNDYGERVETINNSNITEADSLFIVNQLNSFMIFKDVYCSVRILENNYEGNNKSNHSKNIVEDTIQLNIFSYKRKVHEINDMINKLVHDYETMLKISRQDKLFIYTLENKLINDYNERRNPGNYYWEEIEFNSNKNFDNLFFEGKEKFLNKINFFCNNEKYYNNNGIPYTLGISLEGEPGTGKTSIIKCLANYLNRHLVVINMGKIKTNSELNNCFFENTYSNKNKPGSVSFKDKIYIFEDIDCCLDIVKERNENDLEEEKINYKKNKIDNDDNDNNEKNEIIDNKVNHKFEKFRKLLQKDFEDPDKLSLGHILNLIDGIKETPGRIIIMTSNYIDKIDSALKRPGRIDLHMKMNYINYNVLCQMYKHHYNDDLIDNESENYKKILNIIDYNITPAEITNILINSDDKIDFINNLNNILT